MNKLSKTFAEMQLLLAFSLAARFPLLMVGKPGVGKTDCVTSLVDFLRANGVEVNLIITHPAVCDPTDFKGMPCVINGKAVFLPFDQLLKLMNSNVLTICFIDDLGQAHESVQKALMQLIGERQIDGKKISDNVVFFGATNGVKDKSGVMGLIEPLKTRFRTIINVNPSLDEVLNYGINRGKGINSIVSQDVLQAYNIANKIRREGVKPWKSELIYFLKMRSELLNNFAPTRDIISQPCPRTWDFLADWINYGMVDLTVFCGTVGDAAGKEFFGFLQVFDSLKHFLPEIEHEAKTASLPINLNEVYALLGALAGRSTRSNYGSYVTYVERLADNFGADFARLFVADSTARNADLKDTETYKSFVIRKAS